MFLKPTKPVWPLESHLNSSMFQRLSDSTGVSLLHISWSIGMNFRFDADGVVRPMDVLIVDFLSKAEETMAEQRHAFFHILSRI